MRKAASAVIAVALIAVLAAGARSETLAEITAELDRSQEPAEFSDAADRLERLVSAGGAAGCGAYSELARAWYLLGEAEPDEDRREAFLDKAVSAADRALSADPGYTRALYWRSMAYLQKAEIEGGFSALRMVKLALSDFEKVESSEPSYDGAGAYRSHGKVLMEAPTWAFIGDRDRGVKLLEKAREIAPGTLINRLYLAEAYAGTGRREDALAELRFIMAAPLDGQKPADDVKTKDEAKRIMDDLAR